MAHKAFRTSRTNNYLRLLKRTEHIRRIWKRHVKAVIAEQNKPAKKFNPKELVKHMAHANALRRLAQKKYGVTFGHLFNIPIPSMNGGKA